MADWSTIASLSTAAGTLVLAVATFSSVRSSQRTARIAERALLVGLRPVLSPSRASDPPEEVRFVDGRVLTAAGASAAVESDGQNLYFVIPLRNSGSGLAVLHAWHLRTGNQRSTVDHAPPEEFRRVQRDIYVPAGDSGFWQGAIREEADPFRPGVAEAIVQGQPLTVDLMYGDHEGGQRTISRFVLYRDERVDPQAPIVWNCAVTRHWSLEGPDPR